MTTTKTVSATSLNALGLHEGDVLHVLGKLDSMFVVQISHTDAPESGTAPGSATAWLKSARGSIKLAEGETADKLRSAYYADKYQLDL
jgi:hypothetical protein